VDFKEAREQWQQLDYMQIICTSHQTDNHVTSSLIKNYHTTNLAYFHNCL